MGKLTLYAGGIVQRTFAGRAEETAAGTGKICYRRDVAWANITLIDLAARRSAKTREE